MNTQAQVNITKFLDEKIAAKDIGGIYCFFGDEEYMLDYYIKKIYDAAAKSGSPETDCAAFDGDNFDIVEFTDAVFAYPVASDFKFIVVKQTELGELKNEIKAELIKILSDSGIGDDVCVIFKSSEFGGSTKKSAPKKTAKVPKKSKSGTESSDADLVEFLKENGTLCEFKENTKQSLVKWIKKITASENLDISDANASYILSRAGNKMYPLRGELDKLAAYVKAENRSEIGEKDIELLVADKFASEIEAFGLSNSISGRNYAKAAEILQKHKNQKDEPVVVLGQIARHFCDMLAVNLALSGGISDRAAIAKKTGFHEYKVKLIIDGLRGYKNPAKAISHALNLCRTCDIRLKSTSIPSYQILENLIYTLSIDSIDLAEN